MFMLKNSDGKKSFSFTMVAIGFSIVSLWLLVSIVAKIGHVDIRAFSGSEASLYLAPLLALYYGRRNTEAASKDSKTPDLQPPSDSASSTQS